MTTPARLLQTQQVHFLRKGVNFGNAGTLVNIGVVPANSVILPALSGIAVSTGFNGATQTATFGTSASTALWGSGIGISASNWIAANQSASYFVAGDTLLQGFVSSTGATAGVGHFIICYVPDL